MNIQEIESCIASSIPSNYPRHDSNLLAGTREEGPVELDVPGHGLVPQRHEVVSQQVVHKVCVGTSGNIPAHLDRGIPASEHLFRLFSKEVPQHTSIQITTVDLNSLEHLSWISKLKSFSYSCCVFNELPSLAVSVILHVTLLV